MIRNKPGVQGHVIGSLEHDRFIFVAETVWRCFNFVGGFVYMFGLPDKKQQEQGAIQTDDDTDNGENNIH